MHLYLKFLNDIDKIKVTAPVEYIKNHEKGKTYKIGQEVRLFWSAKEDETPQDVLEHQNRILDSEQLPKITKGSSSSRAAYYPAEVLYIAKSVEELENHIENKRVHVPTYKKSSAQQQVKEVSHVSSKKLKASKPISDTKNFENLAKSYNNIISSDDEDAPLRKLKIEKLATKNPKEAQDLKTSKHDKCAVKVEESKKNVKDKKTIQKRPHNISSESSCVSEGDELVSTAEYKLEVFTLKSELRSTKSKLVTATNELNTANEKLRKKRKEITKLSDENEGLRKKITQLSTENNTLRDLNMKYQQKFLTSPTRAGSSRVVYHSPHVTKSSPMKFSPRNKTSVTKMIFDDSPGKHGIKRRTTACHDSHNSSPISKFLKKSSSGSDDRFQMEEFSHKSPSKSPGFSDSTKWGGTACHDSDNGTPIKKIAQKSSSGSADRSPLKELSNESTSKSPDSGAGYEILTEEAIKEAGLTSNGKKASDSLFVKNLALAIFGSTVLLTHSVQGKPCNRSKTKSSGSTPQRKPRLPEKELQYLTGLFEKRLRQDGVNDKTVLEEKLSKVGFYITEKMGTLRKSGVNQDHQENNEKKPAESKDKEEAKDKTEKKDTEETMDEEETKDKEETKNEDEAMSVSD